jgi:hypothetical protein
VRTSSVRQSKKDRVIRSSKKRCHLVEQAGFDSNEMVLRPLAGLRYFEPRQRVMVKLEKKERAR